MNNFAHYHDYRYFKYECKYKALGRWQQVLLGLTRVTGESMFYDLSVVSLLCKSALQKFFFQSQPYGKL